ncbi:MAG: helix-turn-helix domain-containing protein, partial [Micromonosporaceae bacterium]|nr:helix-turn-helix domain-containing protein [Micromonosporaceae bacterium]
MTTTADSRAGGAPTALAAVMAERGLRTDEVASAARVNPATLHRWSTGRFRPRGPAAERLAATLGEPAERLFPHLAGRTPLRAALDRQGLSVRDLARRVGAHENSVYSWVVGHYQPQPELAERAADVLDAAAADLFPDIADRLHQARTASPAAATWPDQAAAQASRSDLARPAERGEPSRLAAVLAERGMTATGLARAVNVTPSTVGKWADGAAPTVEHAEQA